MAFCLIWHPIIIRTLREDLKKEKEEGRKERDRCDRLRGENWNLLEKVKYWEKFDAQKNERKRKVREEQEEDTVQFAHVACVASYVLLRSFSPCPFKEP
jgi:hypothetical protein